MKLSCSVFGFGVDAREKFTKLGVSFGTFTPSFCAYYINCPFLMRDEIGNVEEVEGRSVKWCEVEM